MRTRAEAEALVPKVRAALSEMGGGDWPIELKDRGEHGWRLVVCHPRSLQARAITWTAFRLDGEKRSCWSCCDVNSGSWEIAHACRTGNCAHPEGPARPPRELLVPRR